MKTIQTDTKQLKLVLVLLIAGGSLTGLVVVVLGSVQWHRDLLVQEVERYLFPTDIQNIFLKHKHNQCHVMSTIDNNSPLVHGESPGGDPRGWFCRGG